MTPPKADRLLIIRLGALGDVVRTLPAAAALRALYPGSHLSWLVEPGAAGVVEAARVVDETLIFPRGDLSESLRTGDALSLIRQTGSFLRRLRRRRFEIVLDFHGILKSGLLARLSGAPHRYGYAAGAAREFAELFVNHRVTLPRERVSRFDRNAALLDALAPGVQIPTQTRLEPTPLAVARLAARLRVSGRERAGGFVLIHPGTSAGTRHKRYPPGAWVKVVEQLAAREIEVWLVSGVGRDERNLADRIVRDSGAAATPAPECRSFDDLLALMARASVFVSGDTGPLHAASMAGLPVVQILGPTDPVQNRPWPNSPHRRVHVPLPCSPCRRGCADAACMSVISPDQIVEAIEALHLVGRGDASRSGQPSR